MKVNEMREILGAIEKLKPFLKAGYDEDKLSDVLCKILRKKDAKSKKVSAPAGTKKDEAKSAN